MSLPTTLFWAPLIISIAGPPPVSRSAKPASKPNEFPRMTLPFVPSMRISASLSDPNRFPGGSAATAAVPPIAVAELPSSTRTPTLLPQFSAVPAGLVLM